MLNPIQRYFPKLHRLLAINTDTEVSFDAEIDTPFSSEPFDAEQFEIDSVGSPIALRRSHGVLKSVELRKAGSFPDLLNQAHELQADGNLPDAIECYRQALQIDPTCGTVYQYLAEALSQQGELEAAAVCYRQAIDLSMQEEASPKLQSSPVQVYEDEEESEDEDEIPWFETASFYLQQGEALYNLGDWTETIAACEQVTQRIEPQLIVAYLTSAKALQQQNELNAAAALYLKAIAIQPTAEAHARLGSLYAQQDHLIDAISQYQQAIAIDPQFAGAYWKLAAVLQQSGDVEQALVCRYRALQQLPEWASAGQFSSLAAELRQQGKLEWAIDCYQQAIRLDSGLAEGYHGLGEALGQQGEWQAAIEQHRQAVLQQPETAQFQLGLGQALLQQAQWDEAVQCFKFVTQLEPKNLQGYQGLGQALGKLDRWTEALSCYQRLADLQPDSGKAFHALGDVLSQLQQWSSAAAVFQQAIALQPDFSWSHNNLGDTLIKLGQWQSAAAAFQQAIALNPEFHWSHYNLGEACVKLEQWDEAIAAYQQALQLQPEMPHAQRKIADALHQRAKADQTRALAYYQQAIALHPDDLQNYHQAIALQPNNADLYVQLAAALARQNNPAGATIFYQQAQKLQPDNAAIAQQLERVLRQRSRFPVTEQQLTERRVTNSIARLPHKVERQSPEFSVEDVRLIAFYLPQYHPIPENDQWWGKGFTEWTNVTKAKPLFQGHHQPQLPTDLGFYDLRLGEVREAQAELAVKYGIAGFCYHYYWFAGKRLLHRPLDDMLATQQPDFPFCICWANENWTRRWDGRDHEVLIAQDYSDEQSKAFAESLVPILQDKRYIRINGKPLILIYRADMLPDPLNSTQQWREVFQQQGIGEVHLCLVLTTFSGIGSGLRHPADWGFDAAVQFPPHETQGAIVPPPSPTFSEFTGQFFDYQEVAIKAVAEPQPSFNLFPGVMPSFDNTARRKQAAHAFLNSNPETYEFWLRGAIEKAKQRFTGEERIVFINAWNEWAEGAHLEPDQFHGHAYLEATYRAGQGTHSWRTTVNLLRHLPIVEAQQRDRLLYQLERRVDAIDRASQVTLNILHLLVSQQKAKVIEVTPSKLDFPSSLDAPVVETLVNLQSIKLDGWVYRQGVAAVAIEVKQGSHLLQTAPINMPRADVAHTYNLPVNTVGFLTQVELSELSTEIELQLNFLFEDNSTYPWRSIRLQPHSDSEGQLQLIQEKRDELAQAHSLPCETLLEALRQVPIDQMTESMTLVDQIEQAIDAKEWHLKLSSDFLQQNQVNKFFESF